MISIISITSGMISMCLIIIISSSTTTTTTSMEAAADSRGRSPHSREYWGREIRGLPSCLGKLALENRSRLRANPPNFPTLALRIGHAAPITVCLLSYVARTCMFMFTSIIMSS